MELSSGILYRSIVGESDLSFLFNASFNNVSGESEIGFSGEAGSLNLFKFISGKILDLNSEYVWSYNPRDLITISGNIGSGYVNYFIQDIPVCLYSPKNDYKYYDNFYISTSNTNVNFDLVINGSLPRYNIEFPSLIHFLQPVTGNILNLSSPDQKTFKIYSGDIVNAQNYYDLNPNQFPTKISGDSVLPISLKSLLPTSQALQRDIQYLNPILNLYTNFGVLTKNLSFEFINEPLYFINFLTGFTGITGNNGLNNGYYYNFELQTIFPNNQPFTFKVVSVSGNTGEKVWENYSATGLASGFLQGFVHGFDYITGYLSGIGFSNENNYYNTKASGIFDKNLSLISQYATGNINYNYTLNFTGGSGVGLSPVDTNIIGSGYVSENISKIILGRRDFTLSNPSILTGYWNNSKNVRNGISTLTRTVFYTGNYILNYSDYLWASDNVYGVNVSGYQDKIYGVTGYKSGVITAFESGVQNINSTIYSKQFDAILFQNIVPQDIDSLYNSGEILASENSEGAKNIVIELTGRSIDYEDDWQINSSTGFVGFYFKNFKQIEQATYYKISSNYRSHSYPSSFRLEGSNDLINWVIIDNRPNQTFYPTTEKIYKITSPGLYSGLRLNIINSTPWQHKDADETNLEKLNITELLFYKDIPIERIVEYPKLIPPLTGYRSIPSGDVIYSDDRTGYFAWKAFDDNQYTFAKIFPKLESSETGHYLGFRLLDPLEYAVTGFYIEFEENYTPNFLSIEGKESDDGIFKEYYRKQHNIQAIESDSFTMSKNQKHVRFNFIDKSNTSITNFFPALGTYDYNETLRYGWHYLDFFKQLDYLKDNTSANSKYYEVIIGPCHFFILDSEPVTGGTSRCGIIYEGAGRGQSPKSNSNEKYIEIQKTWFNSAISSSESLWKFVIFNHPPYTSESINYGNFKLSFEEGWRLDLATAVFNGNSRNYERFIKNQNDNYIHYIVNGCGGLGLRNFGTPLAGSVVRKKEYGWTKIEIYPEACKISFISQYENIEKDSVIIGDLYGNPIYKYAIISNYGNNNPLSIDTVPLDYNNPNNNYYTNQVRTSICREENINAIFTAGNNSYPGSETLDDNCGRFYCQYIGKYYAGTYSECNCE